MKKTVMESSFSKVADWMLVTWLNADSTAGAFVGIFQTAIFKNTIGRLLLYRAVLNEALLKQLQFLRLISFCNFHKLHRIPSSVWMQL